MTKRNIKIDSKAITLALAPMPKLIGDLARGIWIPEQLEASIVADVVAAVPTSKGKGKLKKKISSDKPPSKRANKIKEVEILRLRGTKDRGDSNRYHYGLGDCRAFGIGSWH